MVARLGNLVALRDFLSFLMTISGDLSDITAPPFILSPSSLTEFPSFWAERPSLFTAAAHETCPERRMLLVLKLYLASLQRQCYTGRTVEQGLKKPLNPFLGELFLCEFSDHNVAQEKATSSTVRVICEQVSHHPPTTACFLSADDDGVHAQAYSTQQTTMSGTSVIVRQSGHAALTIDRYHETYVLPLVDVCARSILTGTPWPELNDTYRIVSSSGFTAEIKFVGKKMWGGQRNCFTASIYRTVDSQKKALFTLSGSWSSAFSIFDAAGKEIETFDLADAQNQPAPITIKPLEHQSPWESRKAWATTFDAIRRGDHGAVTSQKSKLENAQRQMRKQEQKEGKVWETMFFDRAGEADSDDVVEKLFDLLDDREAERLRGINGRWIFNPDKHRRWKNGAGSQRPKSPLG